MLTSRRGRVAALAVLCGALVALVAWFGTLAPDPGLNAYPTEGDLALASERYVGARAQVSGTVVAVDPVVVAEEYAVWTGTGYETGTARLTVTGLSEPVAVGQEVQAFGTVRPDGTVAAANAVVVPATRYLSMYLVSFLAGCWVLARLLRGWTVEWATLAVRPREEPLAVVERLRTAITEEDATDA